MTSGSEATPTITLDAFQKDSSILAVLQGELVLQNCEGVRERLNALLTENVDAFYLYLGRLEFVDSAGWGAMVGLKMAAHRNRSRFIFLSPTPRIREIFRISKLDKVFDVLEGAEADTIRRDIMTKENVLFRESRDENQGRFVTEAQYKPIPVPEATVKSTLENDDQKQAERSSRDALEHLRNGAYQQAIDEYKKVLEINPDSMSALNNLGVVYEKKAEWYPEAIKTWQRVLQLSEVKNDVKHAERAQKHLQFLERMK